MFRCFEGSGPRLALAAGVVVGLLLPALVLAAQPARKAGVPAAFGLGKVATAQEIAGWDIDVRPDGAGLPAGRGTVALGQTIYDAKCASCHGTFGESTDYIALAGGVGTLGSAQPVRTTGSKLNYATTLFDYIRRAMPFPNPKTLTDDEVYALTAYLLNLNDILPADTALDRDALIALKVPNRDGFTTAHGFMRRNGEPDTHNTACMRNCVETIRLSSEMPDYARDAHGNLAEQMRPMGPVDGTKIAAASGRSGALPAGPPGKSGGAEAAQKAGCMACHAIAVKVVGPAFRDVAARYAGDTRASANLVDKIKSGGAGAWGQVPMPAQAQVNATDAHALVQWILAGAK